MTGIDKALQDRVNTYGTNPAALQKRYQQSQKLIDLLALQQVKSDMQNAKRSIVASMQNNPNTIAAQRENEVLGMAKQNVNDKIQQTAGALSNKQRQQQAQMQKLMSIANKLGPAGISALANKQQARPQQARPQQAKPQPNPMMAAGVNRVPAPNMQGITRAAKGGIIGFDEGDFVPPMNAPEYDLSFIQNLQGRNQARNYIDSILGGGGSNEQKQANINEYLNKAKTNVSSNANVSGTVSDIIESTDTGTMAGAVGSAVKKSIKTDPLGEASIKESFGIADELAGLSDTQKMEMENLYGGLGSLYKSQLSPSRLRRDKLRKILSGAAGYGDIGIMGASMTRKAGQAEAQQDKAGQSAMLNKINTFRNFSGDLQADKRKSLGTAVDIGTQKTGQQTQSMLIGAGLTETMIAGLTTDATNFYKNKDINATSALGKARIIADKAMTAASDVTKLQIAQIHADVSEANNKLVTETNKQMKEETNATQRLQIGINGINRLTSDKVDRLKAIDTMYKTLIEIARIKFLSVKGDNVKANTKRNQYEINLLKLETDLDTQRGHVEDTFEEMIKAIDAKIKGITVN